MPSTLPKFQMRESSPTCLVITCTGSLSWEDREALAAAAESYLQPRPALDRVILDLAAVAMVNSAGLGALFQLVRRVRQHGGRLAFANVSPTLARLFTAVGLDRLADMNGDPAAVRPDPPMAPSSPGVRPAETGPGGSPALT